MQEWARDHWVDIVIVLTLAWYGWDGFRRGFLSLCLETVGFVGAMLAAALTYRFVGGWVGARFEMPPSFADAIAFFGVWWLVDLLWPFAARRLYRRLPERWRAARVNRAFGALPGLLNGALILSVILTVGLAFPIPAFYKKQVTGSPTAKPLLALAQGFDRLFKPILGPLAETGINLLTIRPESGESVDLRFNVHGGAALAEAETEMLALVNKERAERGLKSLAADLRLRDVARAHSRDMFERGYFSHVNPDGLSPSDRVDNAGIRYGVMGENLALAPDVEIAHKGLMDSPGHRENILYPPFRKVGIGVIDGGVYGMMFTQVFTD